MLVIKLIQVGDGFKALVMDMSKKGDRIRYIASNIDSDLAWNEAQSYIDSLAGDNVCH